MKKRKADKPVKIKRKGEGDMTQATAIQKKTTNNNKPITEKGIKNAGRISPTEKGIKYAGRISPAVYKRQNILSKKKATTLFERRLIQKCKNDGMTDKEIREWMREI